MNAIEKLNLIKELRTLLISIIDQKSLVKLKTAKRIREIVTLLDGYMKNTTNQLYQSVLDGAAITVDLIEQMIEEAKKDLTHPQLNLAVLKIRDGLTV